MQKQAMENVRRRVTGECLHLSPDRDQCKRDARMSNRKKVDIHRCICKQAGNYRLPNTYLNR